jgi:lysophospholipase L1-like esterase
LGRQPATGLKADADARQDEAPVSARRSAAAHAVLLLAAVGVAAAASEGVSRILLHPVNYLAVDPVYDSVLGIRLEPGAGGHDAWGFRNGEVPDSAEVVTIGDSQTYGVSAPANLSWPAQLGDRIDRRVYNLSLGGYGPVQYLELLRTRALRLRPKVVVVGVYYGNDLYDAYRVVYGLDHWSALRRRDVPKTSDSTDMSPPREVLLGSARDWLARHSVVYRLVTFTALGGVARRLEFAGGRRAADAVEVQYGVHGASTGLTPNLRLKALDLEDAAVQEGLRLSLDRMERMAEICRAAGVHLLIVLIPTKERVISPRISDSTARSSLAALLRAEDQVDRAVRDHLERLGIRYVSLIDDLQRAAGRGEIYPSNDDGHPTSAGYAVIAEVVAAAVHRQLAPGVSIPHRP